MTGNAKPVVAYLTLGGGEVSRVCYKALVAEGVLAGVVFSRRKKSVSRLKQLREYGVWYIAQRLIFQIENKLRQRSLSVVQIQADGIESIEWNEISDQDRVIQWLEKKKVTVIVVSGFQFILKDTFLKRFDLCVNLHPSLLPSYRGPDPMMWGLLEHQEKFGITLHHIDAGVDTGNILSQISVPRPTLPYVGFVESSLAAKIGQLVRSFLVACAEGSLSETSQTEGEYLPAPTLKHRRQRRLGLL